MKHRIITISREFGSGGRTIGKKTAEQLGLPRYDSELIQKIAQESGFTESYIQRTNLLPLDSLLPLHPAAFLAPPTRTICGNPSVR